MQKRDVKTLHLSRQLLREIVRRSTRDQFWDVSRGTAGEALGVQPDDLKEAAQLLVEEGLATASTSDFWMLRPTPLGRSKVSG